MNDALKSVAAVAERGDTVLIGFDSTLDDLAMAELAEDFNGFTEMTGVHIAVLEGVTSMVVVKGSAPLVGREEPGER